MSDTCIGNINTTLKELQELMILVENSYTEVPPILCKICLEKSEKLCEQIRLLPFADLQISENIEDNIEELSADEEMVAESDSIDGILPATDTILENEDSFRVIESDACAEEEKSKLSDAVEIESISESEADKTIESETSFAISWDTSETDFCLFDRVKDVSEQESEGHAVHLDNEEKSYSVFFDVSAGVGEERNEDDFVGANTTGTLIKKSEDYPSLEEEEYEFENEGKIKTFSGKEIQKMMSINDRFLFRRELFDGDDDEMNATIDDLNHISSYEESMTYLHTRFDWDFESEAVDLLCMLLKQRFE